MIDKQIMQIPKCDKCKERPAITRVYEMWLCLWCLDKIDKKLKENQKRWIQENVR